MTTPLVQAIVHYNLFQVVFYEEEAQHFITHDIFIQEYVGLLVFIVTMVTLSTFQLLVLPGMLRRYI